jgi:hypothetical protein
MHRGKWEAQPNAGMGLEGLQGTPGAAIGHAHQRSPSPYDQGRDQWLAPAAHAFEAPPHTRTEAR